VEMARSKRRNARRRRRGHRGTQPNLPTRLNDIVKGTIMPAYEVELNVKDFSDIPQTASLQLLSTKVTVATTTLADVSIVFYNSTAQNVALRSFNITLCNSQRTFFFRFPPRSYRSGTEYGQVFCQIVNAPCNEEDKREVGIPIWYSCQLWVARAADVFSSTVDPPHFKRKHGTPRSARSLTLDSMAI
jgi:hypothetical protein